MKQRELRKRINDAKDKMTDMQFFTSKAMQEHFDNIIEGVCKKYRKEIHVKIETEGKFVAYTDNKYITVNIGFKWIEELKTRSHKYNKIVGIILHECAHILYTDFKLMEKSNNELEKQNRFFPRIETSEVLTDYLFARKGYKLLSLYNRLDNCIEDGHIEKRIVRKVPGYGECLMDVRKTQLAAMCGNTYEDRIKAGKDVDEICELMDVILAYAKYGIDNTGDVESDLVDTFYEMIPLIDEAVKQNNAIVRKSSVNIIMDLFFQFLEKKMKEKKEEEKEKSKEESESEDSEDKSEKKSESEKSEDKGEKSESEESKTEEETSKSEDGETESETGKDGSDKSEGMDSEDIEDPLSEEEDEITPEEIERILDELEKESEKWDDKSSHGMTIPVDDAEEDMDEDAMKSSETTSEEEAGSDGTKPTDEAMEGYTGAEDFDLSHLEEKAADELVAVDIENDIVKDMRKTADKTLEGRKDKCPCELKRCSIQEYGNRMYESMHQELDRIAKRVEKNLYKILKERQKGDKLNGLYIGKALEINQIYRQDKKIFCNKILPEDTPNMEVCVLVDESGSMSCGERMPMAIQCAYITYRFCQNMHIPVSVYGHTTSTDNRKVMMECAAHPNSRDNQDAKRIFTMRPQRDNRDGWALNFCAEALMKSTANSKLLMVISDGVPAHGYEYGTKLGRMDCQEVVTRYKKKGISVITAGIDSCAEDIRSIYLDGAASKNAAKFLDMSDMTKLPKAFVEIIKKELL